MANISINLNDQLTGATNGGTWTEGNCAGVNTNPSTGVVLSLPVSNITNVNLNQSTTVQGNCVTPGVYIFSYTNTDCNGVDTCAEVEITVSETLLVSDLNVAYWGCGVTTSLTPNVGNTTYTYYRLPESLINTSIFDGSYEFNGTIDLQNGVLRNCNGDAVTDFTGITGTWLIDGVASGIAGVGTLTPDWEGIQFANTPFEEQCIDIDLSVSNSCSSDSTEASPDSTRMIMGAVQYEGDGTIGLCLPNPNTYTQTLSINDWIIPNHLTFNNSNYTYNPSGFWTAPLNNCNNALVNNQPSLTPEFRFINPSSTISGNGGQTVNSLWKNLQGHGIASQFVFSVQTGGFFETEYQMRYLYKFNDGQQAGCTEGPNSVGKFRALLPPVVGVTSQDIEVCEGGTISVCGAAQNFANFIGNSANHPPIYDASSVGASGGFDTLVTYSYRILNQANNPVTTGFNINNVAVGAGTNDYEVCFNFEHTTLPVGSYSVEFTFTHYYDYDNSTGDSFSCSHTALYSFDVIECCTNCPADISGPMTVSTCDSNITLTTTDCPGAIYTWTINSTPVNSSAAVIGNNTSSSFTFNPENSGDYIINLEVTDACGVTTNDQVTVTVQNTGLSEPDYNPAAYIEVRARADNGGELYVHFSGITRSCAGPCCDHGSEVISINYVIRDAVTNNILNIPNTQSYDQNNTPSLATYSCDPLNSTWFSNRGVDTIFTDHCGSGAAQLFPGNVPGVPNETDIYVEITIVFNTDSQCGGQQSITYTSAVARIICSNLGPSCCA
jgi:hypothetical protein